MCTATSGPTAAPPHFEQLATRRSLRYLPFKWESRCGRRTGLIPAHYLTNLESDFSKAHFEVATIVKEAGVFFIFTPSLEISCPLLNRNIGYLYPYWVTRVISTGKEIRKIFFYLPSATQCGACTNTRYNTHTTYYYSLCRLPTVKLIYCRVYLG